MTKLLLLITLFSQVAAQNVRPQIGYVYPTGGRVGTTASVQLGTYDWTPDMQVFVHNPSINLKLTGPVGEFKMTPPPFWFGAKASITQPPLAREVPAVFEIPDDQPIGPVHWQAANANGGSNLGTFFVSNIDEFVEPERHTDVIALPPLPLAVSGRIHKITDSDTYSFTAQANGLVTCRLHDRIGQPFNGVLTVRDQQERVVADAANTTGSAETTVMFHASQGNVYTINVHDVNFSGDRSYVYRLTLEQGPRVVATLPCVLARGQATEVEFIGWGLVSGNLQLESVTREVSVTESIVQEHMDYVLKTEHGDVQVKLAVGVASDSRAPMSQDLAKRTLTCPTSVAGSFTEIDSASLMPIERYWLAAKKGDFYHLSVEAARWGSTADPSLTIVSSSGKELLRSDDAADSVDIHADFNVPEDGTYEITLSDLSGTKPSRAKVYRLSIENQESASEFTLQAPERIDIPLGGKIDLTAKTIRRGAWDEPIVLTLEDLPAGVTIPSAAASTDSKPAEAVPTSSKSPPKRSKKVGPKEAKVTLNAANNVAAEAKLARLVATATINDQLVIRKSQPILISTTLKTRCVVKSAVQDGGRIVNRGTTYPADVIVERLEDFHGAIELQMAATQQRQRRGIIASNILVPAGESEVQYPVFMPEWLETNLTARMNVIGIAQVPDPLGNIRHITGIMDGFIVMSLEGALLKLTHEPQERVVRLGSNVEIPLKISRSNKLPEMVRIELVPDDEGPDTVSCQPVEVPANSQISSITLNIGSQPHLVGKRSVTLRATALQNGRWPAIAETTVPLIIVAD